MDQKYMIAVGQSELGIISNRSVTWPNIVKRLGNHSRGEKAGSKFFVGGYFSGTVRDDKFMVARTLLVIDIDDSGMLLGDLEFQLMMRLDCAFVAYSTYRHTPDVPRVRVVIPLSRELSRDEYRAFSKRFCAELDIPVDGCSFKPNQFMYYPIAPEGAEVWTMSQDGQPVMVPNDLVVDVADQEYGESCDLESALAAEPLDVTDIQVDAYLDAYHPAALEYDEWLKVGMALWHQSQGEWFDKWVEWSKQDSERFDIKVMAGKWKSFGGKANPVTFASIIHAVKASGAVVSTASVQGGWLAQIAACEDKHALEQLVKTKIANDHSLGVVDLASLEAATKARFGELGVTLRADPLRRLFKSKSKRVLPDEGSNELPLETIDNLAAVCDNNDVVIRYNVIKKDDEIIIKDAGWSLDNAKTASITWVRSVCHKVEMKTTNLKNFITLLADSNQFNPVVEWVSSKPWDGVSRLTDFYATVIEDKGQCSEDMKKTVIRTWMVSAIAAAFSPNGIMVRGVLVFQGAQYTGKTRWIDALVPKTLDLVKTGRHLNVHDKDSVKQIVSAWISELGELDATFKKSDIAALKAFITSETDELRRPYAAAESLYPRRTVFAASVNEAKFLQDDTGNSRFWVIPIERMIHDHKLDMQQVWAEFHALWKDGYRHYLTEQEMRELNSHNENFTAPDPIFEIIASHLDWVNFNSSNGKWMQVSDVLRWVGKENPTRFEAILAGKAIQKLNGSIPPKKSHGKQLSFVPESRILSELLDFSKIDENFF